MERVGLFLFIDGVSSKKRALGIVFSRVSHCLSEKQLYFAPCITSVLEIQLNDSETKRKAWRTIFPGNTHTHTIKALVTTTVLSRKPLVCKHK